MIGFQDYLGVPVGEELVASLLQLSTQFAEL